MKVEIKSLLMSKEILKKIIEIDKTYYLDMDYQSNWYQERYNDNNKVTVLIVDNCVVGYFVFYGISEKLFNDICNLKYDNDYYFDNKDVVYDSKYKYFASVLVKKEYRKCCLPLIVELERQFKELENVVAIAVSNEGDKMCSKYMEFIGKVNNKANIYVKK